MQIGSSCRMSRKCHNCQDCCKSQYQDCWEHCKSHCRLSQILQVSCRSNVICVKWSIMYAAVYESYHWYGSCWVIHTIAYTRWSHNAVELENSWQFLNTGLPLCLSPANHQGPQYYLNLFKSFLKNRVLVIKRSNVSIV